MRTRLFVSTFQLQLAQLKEFGSHQTHRFSSALRVFAGSRVFCSAQMAQQALPVLS